MEFKTQALGAELPDSLLLFRCCLKALTGLLTRFKPKDPLVDVRFRFHARCVLLAFLQKLDDFIRLKLTKDSMSLPPIDSDPFT